MRYLFFIFFSFLSLKAFAFPRVDDYARYLAHHKGDTYEIKTLLSEHDSEENSFIQISSMLKNEELLDQEISRLPFSWFFTEKKVQSLLNNCIRRDGALDTFVINGQAIKACTFFNESSQLDYSMGMVPFGKVRFQLYLGKDEFLDFHLVDFKM